MIGGSNVTSISENGVNGQYDRWCKNLGDIKFNGWGDWQRASSDELSSLSSTKGNLYQRYGWATDYSYWSSTLTGSSFNRVHLNYGTSSNNPSNYNYASCVSAS